MTLTCSECSQAAPLGALSCGACGGLLEFRGGAVVQAPETLARTFAARRESLSVADQSGVWRFREFLPALDEASIVSLRENVIPLYDAPRAASYAGLSSLQYFHLGMNPTGSFKDAGMTVAMSHACAAGARVAVCASTGNTAASMAAYAARAGMRCVVLVPAQGVSEAKLAQTLDYGARVIAVEGDFDDALRAIRTLDPSRAAIVNSINPFRVEGQKCAAFALLEARAWKVPAWVVVPGGNLGNSSALGKGFREARDAGLCDRLPRIAVIQARGAAPFARAFAERRDLVAVKAETTATAIKIGAPASWRKALREVDAARGTVAAVSDAAIADARAIVGRDGVGCEPASAATLAGTRDLVAGGAIGTDEDVVLVLTGHVLKDGGYAAAYHQSRAPFANRIEHRADLRDLAAAIEDVAHAS